MAPLTDQVKLRHYRAALSAWDVSNYYIRWTQRAAEWVIENLEGMTTREVARLMWEHVDAGNVPDEVRETREEYLEHAFHYDLRLRIDGRLVYIETRLMSGKDPTDPEDSWIYVVNIHDA